MFNFNMLSYLILFMLVLLYFIHSVQAFNISFIIQPTEQVSLESYNAKFYCSAVSFPVTKITYLWKLNGKFININLNRRFQISADGSLSLNGVTTKDFGVYQCIAQCKDGSIISQPAKLEKAAFRVYNSPSVKAYSEKEGVPFFLHAPTYESKPAAEIKWKICKAGSCQFDQNRLFVTAKGDLLIPALLHTDNGYSFSLVISPKYHYSKTFHYGSLYVQGRLSPGSICPNPAIQFFPSQRNFSINEGQNASLDCLSVFKRCGYPLRIQWKRCEYCTAIGSKRRYQIVNAEKSDEGEYHCFGGGASGDSNRTYHVKVTEKPKIDIDPPNVWSLKADGIVPFGTVRNMDYIHWYSNAERITGNTEYYEVFSNYSLRIKFLSKSLSGIYQIFYYNNAGVTSRTIQVDITNDICGGRLTVAEGEIDFMQPHGLPNGLIHCVWLIQIPDSRYMKLNFTKFDLNQQNSDCNKTKLSVYEGLINSNISNKNEFCYDKVPGGVVVMAGPYITISLITYGSELKNGGFRLIYGYNNTVSTEVPSTTTRTTTSSSSSSSTKRSTTSRTTTGTSTQSTKSTTVSTTQKSTSGKPKTTRKTTKAQSSTKDSFPIEKSTKKLTTLHSSPKDKTRKSTASPKKAKIKDDDDAVTYGAIGGSLGVISITIIAITVICRRRKSSKLPTKTISKEMKIIGSRGSFSDEKYKKRSTVKPPILNYNGLNSTTSETCFTLKEKGRMSRSTFPDVIPKGDSPRYEMGRLGPGYDAIKEENYTELGIGECYTANKRISKLKEEPRYSKIEPSDQSNQYQALMSSSHSSDSSISASHHTLPVNAWAGHSSPLYHTLENEASSMESISQQPTYQALEDGCSSDPVYKCLEVDDSGTNKHEPTYHVLEAGTNRELLYNSLEVADPTANRLEPTYHVLEESNNQQPVYNSLENNSANLNRESFDPSTDYLQPVLPPHHESIAKQGMQPISNEPVYHILTDAGKLQPVYATTDYIEPNPVNPNEKSVIKKCNEYHSGVLIGSSVGAKQDNTYEPLDSIANEKPSDNIYQPVISSDAEYMPIVSETFNAEKNNKIENIYNPTYQPLGDTSSSGIYQPLS